MNLRHHDKEDKKSCCSLSASARVLHEVRGDIITGLGANKRAAVDYQCAQESQNAGYDIKLE